MAISISKRLQWKIIIWSLVVFPVVLTAVMFYNIWNGNLGFMPSFEELENPKSNLASEVYSEDGVLLGTYFKENRSTGTYNELSPYLVDALVSTEDQRYYKHSGVDFPGLVRVFFKTIVSGNKSSGGGSTISQQLAKMLFPRENFTNSLQMVNRKFREWVIAIKLERSYTKEEIIGASIQAIHEPSGTRYATVTNIDGRFTIQGMRTGGPYSVVVSYIGYQSKQLTDIVLQLGETYNLEVWLREETNDIAEVVVVGRASKFAGEKTGATTNISNSTLTAMPTINRSITDIARLSPYANGMGFGGGDARSSNFTLDGANLNNYFGLSTNLPGGGNPVSLDAIEEIQVAVAPYDVRQSNFIGGGINIITKSGTNTFKGTAYIYYNNENMRGNRIDNAELAARERDRGKFVLGPLTLVVGILLAALLCPPKAAAVGILALAFGDGLASLAGKFLGNLRIPYTGGKTCAGSLMCFVAIFVSCFCVMGRADVSLAAALCGMFIEVLPLKDYDNILIPLLLGKIAQYF